MPEEAATGDVDDASDVNDAAARAFAASTLADNADGRAGGAGAKVWALQGRTRAVAVLRTPPCKLSATLKADLVGLGRAGGRFANSAPNVRLTCA